MATAPVASCSQATAKPRELAMWELQQGAAEDDSWLPREGRWEREIRDRKLTPPLAHLHTFRGYLLGSISIIETDAQP